MLFGLVVVEELLEEILERRPRRKLRQFHAGAAFDDLGGRDVDHRRQQFLGQVGEAVRRRLGVGGARNRHQGQGQNGGQEPVPARPDGGHDGGKVGHVLSFPFDLGPERCPYPEM
jgi:hypothetical protein